jgi:hypothetical protein
MLPFEELKIINFLQITENKLIYDNVCAGLVRFSRPQEKAVWHQEQRSGKYQKVSDSTHQAKV